MEDDSADEQLEVPPPKRRRISKKSSDPAEEDGFRVPLATPRVLPRRSSEVLGEKVGMPGMVVRRAKRLGIPSWVFTCMALLMASPLIDTSPRLRAVEFYAGAGTIATAFREADMAAAAVDKSYGEDNPAMDFTTPEGMITLIFYIMILHMRGLTFHAIVCSTWVWMSRGSTGRTSKRPSGNNTPTVKMANVMASRACLVIRLAAAKFCLWGVEQPATSCLPGYRRARQLRGVPAKLMAGEFTEVRTNMGAFGSATLKPTVLIGSPWVSLLQRSATSEVSTRNHRAKRLVTSYKDKKGKRKVTGKPKELKASQEYPPAFGRSVFRAFKDTMTDVHTWNFNDYDVDVTDDEHDSWGDASVIPEQLYQIATQFTEP